MRWFQKIESQGKGVDLLTLFNMQDTETDNVEITCEGRVILLKYNISMSTPGIQLNPPLPPGRAPRHSFPHHHQSILPIRISYLAMQYIVFLSCLILTTAVLYHSMWNNIFLFSASNFKDHAVFVAQTQGHLSNLVCKYL